MDSTLQHGFEGLKAPAVRAFVGFGGAFKALPFNLLLFFYSILAITAP